jgi:3-phosphoshikimate 1-carboxyvinyltransferase
MEASAPPVRLPGCKSLSARALVLAAVAEGSSRLAGLSDCEDTAVLRRALAALGAGFDEEPGGVWRVRGLGGPPASDGAVLDAGEAATNLRFLACLVAAGRGAARITGSPALLGRPHGPLLDFLRAQGAEVSTGADGIRVRGKGLPGGDWRPPTGTSSQFLSGLALAAAWSGEVRLHLPADRPSAGYFDLTLAAVRHFRGAGAVAVRRAADGGTRVDLNPGAVGGRDWRLPADASGATFFLAAAAARGRALDFAHAWSPAHPEAVTNAGWIAASGLLREESAARFLPGAAPDAPLEIDLDAAPDAGPALAVLAAHLPAGIRFTGLDRLRLKESDRLAGMRELAGSLGARVVAAAEALCIAAPEGGLRPAPGSFDVRGDHRLAMAAAIGGLETDDPGCVAKSFPGFWEEWSSWSRP